MHLMEKANGNSFDVPLTFCPFTSGQPMPQIFQIISQTFINIPLGRGNVKKTREWHNILLFFFFLQNLTVKKQTNLYDE